MGGRWYRKEGETKGQMAQRKIRRGRSQMLVNRKHLNVKVGRAREICDRKGENSIK